MWQTTLDTTTVIVAIISALIAAGEALLARRSAKDAEQYGKEAIEQARRATEAEERAAKAAAESAEMQRRIAEFFDRLEARASTRWEVTHSNGVTYRVTNCTGVSVFDVTVTTPGVLSRPGHANRLADGDSVAFQYADPHHEGPRQCVIRWRENPRAEYRTLTREIPAPRN